jgi:hypothetical protein
MEPDTAPSISAEWARVCDEMDAARRRYCEAAKPVVAECDAEASQVRPADLSAEEIRSFVAASDEWALTIAAVNAFARRHLRVP